jgi:hypothetical protein
MAHDIEETGPIRVRNIAAALVISAQALAK